MRGFLSRPPGIRTLLALAIGFMIVGLLAVLGAVDEVLVRHNAFKILSREGRLVAQEFAFGVEMHHEADRFLEALPQENGSERRETGSSEKRENRIAEVGELVSIRQEMTAVLAIRHNVTRVDLLSRQEGLPQRVSTSGTKMSQAERAAHRAVSSGGLPWTSVRSGGGIYVVVPFVHKGTILGTVGIRLSNYETNRLVLEEKERMAFILLAGFLALVTVLSLVLKRWLIDPMERLGESMRAVGLGDLSQEFVLSGSVEIRQAGSAFNRMVTMLREQSREREHLLSEIRRLNEGLRDRIVEKTQELEERNRDLARTNEEMYFLQRRLTELERRAAVGEGLAVVAHELGNPLHSISGHLELLLEEPDLPEIVRRPLRIISGQTDRMVKVLRTLLAIFRRSEPSREPVDLPLLVGEVVDLAEPRLRAAGVSVSVVASSEVPPVMADPHALQGLFINLLENALDAINREGKIVLRVEAGGGGVSVHVEDSGPGIPSELKGRIFDPFFTTKRGGTGLGLAVCRKIVDDLGGEIRVGDRPGGHVVVFLPFGESGRRGGRKKAHKGAGQAPP
ncbi:MAG: sensor histidine kinase [Leptospirillia bacterium]